MALTVINVITFALGVAFIYNGYRLVREGREDVLWFLVLSGVGMGLIVVAVLPDLFAVLGEVIGLEWKARAILVVSNITLFVLVAFLFNQVKSLYDKLSRLNEELSLLRQQLDNE
jgi:hypothetical protein